MSWLIPPLVTEHEPGPDDDCVPCSGVMQILARWPGRCPATLTEAEAIRAASGTPPGPMNSDELVKGITVRYGAGYAPSEVTGFTALWTALTPGHSATASGRPIDAPAGSPFRHWVGALTLGHRVFVERLDSTDRVWVMDPEGPAGTSYRGEWASKSDLQAFTKNGGPHTVQSILQTTRTLTCAAILRAGPSSLSAALATLPAGTICQDLGTVSHGWWALTCNGPHSGRTWVHVKAAGKDGYVPTGRF